MPALGSAPRLMEIFGEAVELNSADDRAAYLDRACGEDQGLRDRVEGLLAAHAQADGFLEAPAVASTVGERPGDSPSDDGPGVVIGPYKLLEEIGAGGMGVVYMAEQTHPVRRRVALKVIRPGMDSRQVLARFEAERQALALMDHPNIARVLDAGTTSSVRPYFVMELVSGAPITEYCDRQQLSISERLELFVLVCRAVQHAHQKGIIHRDLKPSNILVTVIDGAAVPKVLDFGVAKATGQALTDRTLFTGHAQLVGTPQYMSPEQAELSGVDVDTRSDVYSLGVLLYELLTGTTPIDTETLRQAAFDEMRRIIREDEAPRPSTRLSSLGGTLVATSEKRRADPRRLGQSMRGELDWVVMRALEKDRARRYETANDFASDVMRYLSDRPVEACPPSGWYRFSKYARRNRAGLATVAVIAFALVAGTAVSAWQLMIATEAVAEAQLQTDESKQVVDYLTRDVFGVAGLGEGGGRSMTIGELLDQADATIGTRFRGQPLLEASVRMALAEPYIHNLDWGRAERHVACAAELRVKCLGTEHPQTIEALAKQAWVLYNGGRASANDKSLGYAESIGRRVLTARRRVLGLTHPDTLHTQALLAMTVSQRGRTEEAQTLAAQAERLSIRCWGREHLSTIEIWHALGRIAEARGDWARADFLFRQVLTNRERSLGHLDYATLESLNDLAVVAREQGHAVEAKGLYVDTIDRLARVFGLSHRRTSRLMSDLLSMLQSEDDYATIRDLCERWLRELLATPIEADPFLRHRRSLRLGRLSVVLAELPESVPFDGELAARAVEEAVSLERDEGCIALAKVYSRLRWFGGQAVGGRLVEVARHSGLDPRALESIVSFVAYSRSGDWLLANAALETFVKLTDHPEVLNMLAWELAVGRVPMHDPSQAVSLARKAVGLSPQGGFVNTLGVAYYRAGEWDLAIAALEKALSLRDTNLSGPLGSESPDTLVPLAMAHAQRGDARQARAYYDRAVRSGSVPSDLGSLNAEAAALLGVEPQ